MKKKMLALLLAAAMTLSLAACGAKQEDTAQDEETVAADTADTVDTADVSDAEDDAAEDAGAEEEEPDGGQTETTAQESQKPAAATSGTTTAATTTAQKPTESAGTEREPAAGVDLSAFYESLVVNGEWPAMMAVEGEVLDSFYPGLSDIATNQCVVTTAMISAAVGEIALVEVQNGADVQRVKAIFQSRIDYQVGDDENPGGAWYPETIEGWKSGARIVSNGNFIMLVASTDQADNAVSAFTSLF